MPVLNFFIGRLKERSTWLGITSFLTAIGITFSPEQSDQIIATGMAIAGLVAVFSRDS